MRSMMLPLVVAALLMGAGPPAARAADDQPAAPALAQDLTPAQQWMARARAEIKAQNWPGAIDALRRVNATGDADWNNLMGYALRKQSTPDLYGAQRYYDAALRIDPQHRGALEYSGELALMRRDLATAESRLARLAQVCPGGCEAYEDLKQAIEAYKAGGKR